MFLRACALALLLTIPAGAQTVSPGLEHANREMRAAAEREVRQRVGGFLRTLRIGDVSGIRALLAPKALFAVVRQQRDGTFVNTYTTGEEFLAQFEKKAGQPKFEEPTANVAVT